MTTLQQNQTEKVERPSIIARWHRLASRLKKSRPLVWLLIVLFGFLLGGGFNGFLGNIFTATCNSYRTEGAKYVAVVITNKSDESFTIPQEFRVGFGNDADFKTDDSDQKIKFIKEDDALSTKQAELIANKLVNDENCVLIIGNSTSSLTEVTLNTILSYGKDKPSFILPIATADNIIDKAKDQNFGAILRMMPNNEQQATTIKNFVFQKFPENPKVAIYMDEENLTYSQNLSQKISDKILKYNGTIILKKNYGNSNRLINDKELLQKHDQMPDIFVFVGISSNGSLLMEELKNLDINIPVVFTDGCTVKSLMDKSRNNPNHYYISAVQKPINENDAPTYQPVGEDARELAKLILKSIDGDVTRKSVYDYIVKIKTENKMIMDDGKAGKYQFNDLGENLQMHWKVYHYENGALTVDYENN